MHVDSSHPYILAKDLDTPLAGSLNEDQVYHKPVLAIYYSLSVPKYLSFSFFEK